MYQVVYISDESEMTSSSSGKVRYDICCDPFNCHTTSVTKGLRQVSEDSRTKHQQLKFRPADRICTSCRMRLAVLPPAPLAADETAADSSPTSDEACEHCDTCASTRVQSSSDDVFIWPEHELSVLNQSLDALGESPIRKRRVYTRRQYTDRKCKSIQGALKRKLEVVTGIPVADENKIPINDQNSDLNEMIDQLKDKFNACTLRSEKVHVLTVLPKSWAAKKISEEFQVSNYMARKAKKLVKERGVLSTPNPKAGKTLQQKTVSEVKEFITLTQLVE